MKQRLWFTACTCIFFLSLSAQLTSVKTNNTEIFYLQKGEGKPAVIFVSGMAHDHNTWQVVQDSVSLMTRTISYDRAGLGQSPVNGARKDLLSMAEELNILISNLKLTSPAILVGHSMGCQIIKMFASRYPQKVGGVVFVDPGYDEDILKERAGDSLWNERQKAIKKYQPNFNEGQKLEDNAHLQVTKDADKVSVFPNVPVVMFTATMITDFPANPIEQQVKKERHELWLKQMPGSKHLFVDNSWHYIHVDAPQEVIREIDGLVNLVRQKSRP
jgi:hypothetical protein